MILRLDAGDGWLIISHVSVEGGVGRVAISRCAGIGRGINQSSNEPTDQ